MNVTQAVEARSSIRAFLNKPIPNSIIKELLITSSRSPSGGNLQPWKIFIINDKNMKDFLLFQSNWDKTKTPRYEIYSSK